MVQWEHARTPASALLLVRFGAERGVPDEVALTGTGLRTEDLHNPDGEVSARQELTIIGNLVAALGDAPGLGLDAGRRYHLTSYGLWGFMLVSSPTPRSAVDVALRYLDLTFAYCRIEPRGGENEMAFALEAEGIPRRMRRFVIEREAAAIQTIQREAFGEAFRLSGVEFAFPAPDDGDQLALDVFGMTPRYDAPESLLVFDGDGLDQPMPQADEHAAALAQAQCRALLERRRARSGVAGRVRDVLTGRLADPPDAEAVATELHLSRRTLQRRLAQEGTSLRALHEEVRSQLAEELLVTAALPVAEVARRLGYAEVSSFSQAFRRWHGVGPRAFRAASPGVGPGRASGR